MCYVWIVVWVGWYSAMGCCLLFIATLQVLCIVDFSCLTLVFAGLYVRLMFVVWLNACWLFVCLMCCCLFVCC